MDFSDIALAKLLQTVPELGNYIITFKDVSEELQDDTGIQVGVFVLRVGSEIFFIPVVAKNDNVYPIDSIFFDTDKKFFPLTKKTVTMVVASSQLEQGKPTEIPKTVVGNPSVADMINPPRTGKHVYASTSRLTDFLASMPDYLKQVTMEKIAAEKSVYDSLDQMYGLKAIFDVLKKKPQSMAAATNEAPISVVTDANPSMTPDQISSILNDGYHISGEQPSSRVAVCVHDFNSSGTFRNITNLDGDKDFEIMLTNGSSRDAYVPKMYTVGSSPRGVSTSYGRSYEDPTSSLAIFTSGDYALSGSFITVGDNLDRKEVLKTLFQYNPPVMLKDVESGDKIVIVLNSGRFLGPISINRVALSSLGVEATGSSYQTGYGAVTVYGYRNLAGEISICGKGSKHEIYIPHNSVILKLRRDITGELEVNVNAASHKRKLTDIQWLGEEMNIGYDGIEFAINGKTAGAEADVMKRLVVGEGIDPEHAASFVKQAKEVKFAKVYMTKRAGFTTDSDDGKIPSYGEEDLTGIEPDEVTMNGAYKPNGNMIPNVQESLKAGDAQVTEATIISELLQAPDMFELINEYLPDIEEAIDKLGRTLFMARVHISRLAEANDADQVYAFLASLKTVYRLLGDNFIKLKEMAAVSDSIDTEAPGKQMSVKE
jgi:hypothetical protein